MNLQGKMLPLIADLRSTELTTIAKESSKNAEDLFKFDLLN